MEYEIKQSPRVLWGFLFYDWVNGDANNRVGKERGKRGVRREKSSAQF